jgi:phenylalanyl-tRNA synthetase alpha chain
MRDSIKRLEAEAEALIKKAETLPALEAARVKFLGRNGELAQLISQLGSLSQEDRPVIGKIANEVKNRLGLLLDEKKKTLTAREEKPRTKIDVTMPGRRLWLGRKHPITQTMEEILAIFFGMGFQEELGPEIESDWYNFAALNIPQDHPARDMFQSFFFDETTLLRSHTSPVQIRVMERQPPPVRIVAPGRVFRYDPFDASHSPVFYQVEGLYVDEGVSFADLKGTLEVFCRKMFGEGVKVRFSPSYFPFTEPSAEVAISCVICEGAGCPVCKNSGWVEILGCGMVHPKVLENVKYDSDKYTGYAFGMGVERVAIIKYRIDDIRLFYENDLRFLEQF